MTLFLGAHSIQTEKSVESKNIFTRCKQRPVSLLARIDITINSPSSQFDCVQIYHTAKVALTFIATIPEGWVWCDDLKQLMMSCFIKQIATVCSLRNRNLIKIFPRDGHVVHVVFGTSDFLLKPNIKCTLSQIVLKVIIYHKNDKRPIYLSIVFIGPVQLIFTDSG